MKRTLTAALATLVFAGNALATDGLRIESEAQFVRDYSDNIEQVGPGVYLIIAGKLAGKTVSIGEAGLAYDIRVQRGQLNGSGRVKTQAQTSLREMEGVRARYKQLHALQATDAGTKKAASGSLPCYYYPFNGNPIWYYGYAQVYATTELYLDNGGGGLNYYYARASASAAGNVFPPYNVPTSLSMNVSARAENRDTGQVVQYSGVGYTSAGVGTGYVYSGPAFGHNLFAVATVNGIGNCFGYVSISDSMLQ